MDEKLCPKCLEMKTLTKHHIYPKRFFRNSPIFWLCRECHDDLEMGIPYKPKLQKSFYLEILVNFLKGGQNDL